jgi:hypothetical protein
MLRRAVGRERALLASSHGGTAEAHCNKNIIIQFRPAARDVS